MTYDAAADAVSGPGGTSPGPSAVDPNDVTRDAVDGLSDAVDESSDGDDGSSDAVDVTLPPELAEAARTLFGDRLDLAASYAELLATEGVVRGLIGPREAPRIWSRHLLNCAAVAERIPTGATVLDVGSGAGLPGIILAVARPDLSVVLIEPLARRTSFLVEAVQALGVGGSVRVVRGRADEVAAGTTNAGVLTGDIVTARAVAPLDRLAAWCLPLLGRGGRLLALKGASAAEEIAEHAAAVEQLGGGEPVVHQCGVGLIDPPTTVVEIVRERMVRPPGTRPVKPPRSARRAGSSGSGVGRRPRRG